MGPLVLDVHEPRANEYELLMHLEYSEINVYTPYLVCVTLTRKATLQTTSMSELDLHSYRSSKTQFIQKNEP